MRKIIVRMPNWIGDFVMGLPVLEDIKQTFPDSHLTVLCSEPLKDLLYQNPFVDAIIPFSRKKRFFPDGVIPRLRKERFDLGILLTNSFSSWWLFFAGRVKKIACQKQKKEEHLVISYKRLLEPLGIQIRSTSPTLYVEKKRALRMRIGINPGAAYGEAKCWLPDRFKEVAIQLSSSLPNTDILFFGDLKTKPLVDEIVSGLPSNVINLAGKTSLLDLIKEIASLDVFLTNDSGPMHIAAALKTPLVALFGSTNDKATGPYQWGEVIHKRVACSPCYKRVCPIDFRCMKEIHVDEVVKKVKSALLLSIKKDIALPLSLTGINKPEPSFPNPSSPKKAGCIILAAGAGRRLGFDMPKGCLTLEGKSLFEILLEKMKGEKVAIMTSPLVHEKTRTFLAKKGYGEVPLFPSRVLARETTPFSESPEGNGALFEAFYSSDIWQNWNDIEVISVIPIDNPLADPFQKSMIFHANDLRVKAIEKEDRDEKVGTLVEKNKRLHVIEYSEIPSELKGEYSLAYSGMFSCSKAFFAKMAQKNLPWHKVVKQDGIQYEKFVFDAFPFAEIADIVMGDREKEFAPIKTKEDIALCLSRL